MMDMGRDDIGAGGVFNASSRNEQARTTGRFGLEFVCIPDIAQRAAVLAAFNCEK